MMKKRILNFKSIAVLIGIFLLLGGTVTAQVTEPPVTVDEWLGAVEKYTAEIVSSVDVGAATIESFFDVFVEVVLREGLEESDPVLGRPMTTEEVTEALRTTDGVEDLLGTLGGLQIPNPNPELPPIIVDLTPGAAAFKWGRAGRWSRGPHEFYINNGVRVNQWIRASMNKTNIFWKVLKPGTYSTDCMYLNVHSNGPMTVTLTNSGPLVGPGGSVLTDYALSEYIPTPQDWVEQGRRTFDAAGTVPAVINWVGMDPGSTGSADIGPHKLMKVWNYIEVNSLAGPGDYGTADGGPSAVITVTAAGVSGTN
jgi:hypothetical protein